MKEPNSMDECVYFTIRTIKKGKIKAWVLKKECPKCKKDQMSKPKDLKTGRPKIRATEYVCSECNHTLEKKEYEESLNICIKYTCPYCSHQGELEVPFKRKKIQLIDEETGKKKAADSVRFQCEKCGKDIDITKKMKGN